MDPRITLIIQHLDRLIKSAIEQTIEKTYGGVPLLDYVNAGENSYLDLLAEGFTRREDGLLVYGPYDLESVAGKGSLARNDLSLAIEPIVGDETEELLGFRLSLRDQSTVEVGGLNPFRKQDNEIFFLELGEFATAEEANNLFTKTIDVDGRTAVVSLVGDKLDEIFPNSIGSIEMALSNKGPVISERIRTNLNRSFAPDYIVKAMEQVDKEQYEQYGELLGDVDTPDTVEAAAADIVPDTVEGALPFTNDDVEEVTNDYVKNNWQDHKSTADGIVMRINDQGDPEILLIKRKRGPHRGDWALPGGIIDEATQAEYDELAQRPTDKLDWQGKDRAFTKTYQRGPRGIFRYTILKELVEETGLPLPEIDEWYDNKYLGTKINRFDWDARATNGVDVGGHFYFMSDNTWEPTASDDAVKAEWKSLKSILDGETTLAFGHGEWIEDILTDNDIVNKHLSILFDDNPAYLYGVDKPDNTLGTYDEVLNKIKNINATNKSDITQLITAVNIAREAKGMNLIPVDTSNVLGSKEKFIQRNTSQ